MKSVKYLEKVREQLEKKTDGELAAQLGMSKAAISHYLTGRRIMDEETCLAVALKLGINPMEVMMAAGIDRAEKSGQSSLWTVFSQRMAATAASALFLAVNLFLTPHDANAATMRVAEQTTTGNINYAKSW